jgi:hypothetical protein
MTFVIYGSVAASMSPIRFHPDDGQQNKEFHQKSRPSQAQPPENSGIEINARGH